MAQFNGNDKKTILTNVIIFAALFFGVWIWKGERIAILSVPALLTLLSIQFLFQKARILKFTLFMLALLWWVVITANYSFLPELSVTILCGFLILIIIDHISRSRSSNS